MTTVMIGTIHPNTVTTGYMESVLNAFIQEPRLKAVQLERGWPGGMGESRNRLTSKFMDSDYEWLWLVDTDIIFAPATLDRLLSHGRDIVSANYSIVLESSNWKWQPRVCAYNWADPVRLRGLKPLPQERYEGLLSVGAVGAGCLLVNREVFERIGEKWWSEWNADMGEDVSFCKRAIMNDYHIWFDTNLKVFHQKTIWI